MGRIYRAASRAASLAGWVFGLGLTALLLAACDPKRISELEEGVSTEADVRSRFGEPEAVYGEEGGGRTLEYPRQPAGKVNYMITIGPDGKMSALRQVLKPDNFAKVVPGWDKAQVRRLLGRPGKVARYALKDEEIWDWKFAGDQGPMQFSVSFDPDGRVTSSATRIDPDDLYKG